jgi:hypothetical protein
LQSEIEHQFPKPNCQLRKSFHPVGFRGGEREEGIGKREEGGGRREEGRGKREEGRGKREEGRGKREEGGEGRREEREGEGESTKEVKNLISSSIWIILVDSKEGRSVFHKYLSARM